MPKKSSMKNVCNGKYLAASIQIHCKELKVSNSRKTYLYLMKFVLIYAGETNCFLLKDITDNVDFCFNLAKEESVILLPGNEHIDNRLEHFQYTY